MTGHLIPAALADQGRRLDPTRGPHQSALLPGGHAGRRVSSPLAMDTHPGTKNMITSRKSVPQMSSLA